MVGRAAVRWFHERFPDIPALIGGRNLAKAEDVARESPPAAAVSIDLEKPGLELDDDLAIGGVAMLASDQGLHGLTFAQDRGVPYLTISTGLCEVAPEVAHGAHRSTAAPVVLASHWSAGAPMFLALRDASAFESVRSIRVGVILDEKDPAGPASYEDMNRLAKANPGALAFEDGRRVWLLGEPSRGTVMALDGRRLDAQAFSTLDVASLHAATGAPNIRLDLLTGESSSRRRGAEAAAEIVVEIEGKTDGKMARSRSVLEFKHGQASLTGLSAVLSLTAALGLNGRPPANPGLCLPELLVDPNWFLTQLQSSGAKIHETEPV